MFSALIAAALLVGQVGTEDDPVRTENFRVQAETPQMAQKVAHYAEVYRRDIAQEWFGEEAPKWGFPNILMANVKKDNFAVNQSIFFVFSVITVEGDETDIIYSSLPHEICHSVMRYKLGMWLPRWADEGMAMLCERESMGGRPNKFLLDQAGTEPICEFLVRKDYPLFFKNVFYGQAYSLTQFLVEKKGKREFTKFLDDARMGAWADSALTHYGYKDLHSLEDDWKAWHRKTYGAFQSDPKTVAR